MIYDALIAPFTEFEFMRRALAGVIALSLGGAPIGVFCVVGPQTREAAPAGFAFRELDLVRVKGKHHPVAIHELLAAPAAVVAEYRELALWQPTLVAYREGDLAAARAGFTAFAAANPDDLVARLYLERLAELGDVAPAGWDGVITYQRK